MAASSITSSALTIPRPPLTSSESLQTFFIPNNSFNMRRKTLNRTPALKAEFDISFFERDLQGNDGSTTPIIPGSGFPDVEGKEEPQCPPGLRQYETMVVLRPDMSEDERLAFTQKYEELLVAGGGMYVEVFNRGVIPLAYGIRKKNKAGESNTYLDGIYLLFTYFTKPESLSTFGETLLADDDVIRSSSFKIRKRKLF
ncbi:hypothetical protein RD792_006705 [Penstemon davidsonii]|uniref:Ribosomal protein S6 n=1 Tax=Penstemon davidsonii TaxID=160366 RepID=A0ABR0DBY4_9LAMI|nr:hypothetical protein RD792_006705 [Penstemon davidsonii]